MWNLGGANFGGPKSLKNKLRNFGGEFRDKFREKFRARFRATFWANSRETSGQVSGEFSGQISERKFRESQKRTKNVAMKANGPEKARYLNSCRQNPSEGTDF